MLSNFSSKTLCNFNFGIVANDIATTDIKEILEAKFSQFIKAMNIDTSFIKEYEFNNLFTDIDFLNRLKF